MILVDTAMPGRVDDPWPYLSVRGRETFRRRFSPDAFVDALGQAYRDLGFTPTSWPTWRDREGG